MTLGRRVAGEALATALLLATIIGSGVMGENLAQGNTAIALLANTLATGAMLVVLILVAQFLGAAAAVLLYKWNYGDGISRRAADP